MWRQRYEGSEDRTAEKWLSLRLWTCRRVSKCDLRSSEHVQNLRPPALGYLTAARQYYAGQVTTTSWLEAVGDTKTGDCRDSRRALDSLAFYLLVDL